MRQGFKHPASVEELHELQKSTTELLREHRERLVHNRLMALGRNPAAYGDFKTRAAAAGEPKATTVAKYLGRGRRMYHDALKCGYPLWVWVEGISGTLGSWRTAKVATQYFLMHAMREAKRIIDDTERAAKLGAVEKRLMARYREACLELPDFANALAAMPLEGSPERFRGDGRTKRARNSKSASLRGLPRDWRERMADAMPPALRRLWLLQCLTGCRPQELENGARVVLRADGMLQTIVVGAKVRTHAGQPERELLLPQTSGVARALARELSVNEVAGADWLDRSVDAYRQAVARVGKKVFPNRPPRTTVTAYSARHAFKSDLRAAQVDAVWTAKALGHVNTRSGRHYYGGSRKAGGGISPTNILATREVRVRRTSGVPSKRAAQPAGHAPRPRQKMRP